MTSYLESETGLKNIISSNLEQWLSLPMSTNKDFEITQSEYEEACKMFFENCAYESQTLAQMSADSLSRIEMSAVIRNDVVGELIANDARWLKSLSAMSQNA